MARLWAALLITPSGDRSLFNCRYRSGHVLCDERRRPRSAFRLFGKSLISRLECHRRLCVRYARYSRAQLDWRDVRGFAPASIRRVSWFCAYRCGRETSLRSVHSSPGFVRSGPGPVLIAFSDCHSRSRRRKSRVRYDYPLFRVTCRSSQRGSTRSITRLYHSPVCLVCSWLFSAAPSST